MNYDLYGLIGIVLILVAWLPETIKNIKSSKVSTRTEFLVLYTVGSFLLTVHAYILRDLVFLVLNALATIISGSNLLMKRMKK